MIEQPKTAEEIADLKAWIISLLDDLPPKRLAALANAVEDVAFTLDGDDPFYAPENMARLRASIQKLEGSSGNA